MIKELTDLSHLSFAHPYYFALLLLVPFMIWWQGRKEYAAQAAFRLTTLSGIKRANPTTKVRLRPVLFVLRIVTLVMLAIALARPQSSNTTENIDTEGIDIVMCLDVSGSMLSEDLKPNRIEAAKAAALQFVEDRPADRIGLVIFSGESFSMCPITIDHNVLKEQINQVKSGMLIDGTSIGMGLSTAVDRLRNSKSKTKVIVLLTDGVNNTGLIDPNTALEIAKAFHIRIYTIGAGSQGQAMMPIPTANGTQRVLVPVEIDEVLLKQMAQETGGKYFRATNSNSLSYIYKEIDKLEKTKVEVNSYKHYSELFFPFALIALISLFLEMVLRYTLFKSIT